jgi:hypothetical protein
MQLWNDYEGKTLAGTFPIETLLFTEGRNASFATHRDGRPAVLRLTEALNDQQEMRARYGAIREVGQPNLVEIEDFGDVEMEGTPLIYLVMEPTQESLADIVRVRRLSIEETGEVATSLVGALEALHAHGLVHGQVEPASVLAAGQVIKLRSDCVRPAPEGEDGEKARAEDVFGLADVLNRSLTQQPLLDASDALALPEPYASIVRNVARGSWGLEKVAAELRRFVRPPVTAPVAPPAATAPTQMVAPAIEATQAALAAVSSSPADPAAITPAGPPPLPPKPALAEAASQAKQPQANAAVEPVAGPLPAYVLQAQKDLPGAPVSQPDRTLMLWLGGAAGVCLLLVLVWYFATGNNKTPADVASAAAVPTAVQPVPAAVQPTPATAQPAPPPPTPAATAPTPSRSPALPLHGLHAVTPIRGEVWRVVAYTYNEEAQARSKARAIEKAHSDLHPQVFSRTGHAPYLVTLGGPLTEQQAAAIKLQARSEGLPRDLYMQNYSH